MRKLRVGFIASAFAPRVLHEPKPDGELKTDADRAAFAEKVKRNKAYFDRQLYDQRFQLKALDVLREMGVRLEPVELPSAPYGDITPMLEAEAAAAFDELTRSGRDALLAGQEPYDWPQTFRLARLYPAVEYIQAAAGADAGRGADGRCVCEV